MTVCYYHVKQEFQGESTLYQLPECQRTLCSKQKSVRLQTKWLWVRITEAEVTYFKKEVKFPIVHMHSTYNNSTHNKCTIIVVCIIVHTINM